MSSNGVRVHFVREPFELAASFYLYHLSDRECNKEYSHFCKQLQHESLEDGVLRTAQHLLKAQLPRMLQEHRALHGQPNTLTLRLEDWDNDFSATLDSLLRLLRVDTSSAGGQSLRQKALHENMHSAAGMVNSHTTHASLDWGVEFRIHKTLIMHTNICRALGNYTHALGYSHSLQAVMARCM